METLDRVYKKISGIYKIVNTTNNHCYIGSAVDLWGRSQCHKSLLVNNKHPNIHLQRAYNKYEKERFISEVVFTCTKEQLLKLEQIFIDQVKPEYNIAKIAGNCLGIKRSVETREKQRQRKLGIRLTREHNEKAVKARIGLKQTRESIDKRVLKLNKKLRQYTSTGDLIRVWPSLISTQREGGMKYKTVANAIYRKHLAYNCRWEYEQPERLNK